MAEKVESFLIDHTKMKAPFVRKCSVYKGPKGDQVSKFDVRFMQPNAEEMKTGAIHTLEHLMAGYLREDLDGIIDLSPMGCRTGFYLTIWGDCSVKEVISALENALQKVVLSTEIPAVNEIQCGNYRDHCLEDAIAYAEKVLSQGISDNMYGEQK